MKMKPKERDIGPEFGVLVMCTDALKDMGYQSLADALSAQVTMKLLRPSPSPAK